MDGSGSLVFEVGPMRCAFPELRVAGIEASAPKVSLRALSSGSGGAGRDLRGALFRGSAAACADLCGLFAQGAPSLLDVAVEVSPGRIVLFGVGQVLGSDLADRSAVGAWPWVPGTSRPRWALGVWRSPAWGIVWMADPMGLAEACWSGAAAPSRDEAS